MTSAVTPQIVSPLDRIEQHISLLVLGNLSRLSWWLRGSDGSDPRTSWARKLLSWRRLRGDGIEIGALHKPLATPLSARVRYVDRYSVDDLRRHYPELAQYDLIDPHIVDDGERLASIGPRSLDFIIANHFIEHCENPIATIENHLSKLKRGGVLYLAVPMRHMTFDRKREPTSIEHLERDYEEGPEWSRKAHYLDWVRNVNDTPEPSVESEAERLMAESYSIHYHVWDYHEFSGFLTHLVRNRGLPFRVVSAVRWQLNPFESIFVLKKTGD